MKVSFVFVDFKPGTYREKEAPEPSIALPFSYSYVDCPIVLWVMLLYLK